MNAIKNRLKINFAMLTKNNLLPDEKSVKVDTSTGVVHRFIPVC
jgi:hypothetical protein